MELLNCEEYTIEGDKKKTNAYLQYPKGWGNVPLDILMLVFERLSPEDLMKCISVNQSWRDAVNYMGLHRGIWKQLAQAAMPNKGIDLRRRSTLGWRGLYVNYQLWFKARRADLAWSYEFSDKNIRSLHVYKDIVITERGEDFLKKYYFIGEQLKDVTHKLVDADASPIENMESTTEINSEKEFSYTSDKMIKMLVQESPFRRLLVLDEDCYYMLNENNILRCIKWDETNKRWLSYVLARYYGCYKSISDINVYNDEVYVLLKTGLVFRLDKEGRNFIPDRRFTHMTPAQFEFSRMLYGHVLTTIERVDALSLPNYSTGKNYMFHRINVVVAVPWEKEFKMSVDPNNGNIVLEYPGLSCASQHGELLLLGFKDGKVEICIPKNFTENGGVCEVTANVQDCPNFKDEDPEIVALEVYEDEETHHLFVATHTSVYRLMVTYPEEVVDELGLRTNFVTDD